MSTQSPLWKTVFKELQYVYKLGKVKIHFFPEKCKGVWQCYNVCPVGCWTPDYEKRVVVFHDSERCIACNACVLQCPENAIELK